MFLQSSYITELLAEANMVFTQEDYGNKLTDILTPMKHVFLEDKQILPYSLVRYGGGDSRLGFFAQWYYYNYIFIQNHNTLFEYNKEYITKKVKPSLLSNPGVQKEIDEVIKTFFIPHQLQIFKAKSIELATDTVFKYPYMSKYISASYQSTLLTNDLTMYRYIYNHDIQLNLLLEAQSMRSAFTLIGYPILLGFYFAFNQPDNPINAKAIQWSVLEDILKQIAFLYQTNTDTTLIQSIYRAGLGEARLDEWYLSSNDYRIGAATSNPEALQMIERIKEKVHTKCESDLEHLAFPDTFKKMLYDLLDWASHIPKD